eukprot:1144594-Pelagomonas_calceolata.AAC.4
MIASLRRLGGMCDASPSSAPQTWIGSPQVAGCSVQYLGFPEHSWIDRVCLQSWGGWAACATPAAPATAATQGVAQ